MEAAGSEVVMDNNFVLTPSCLGYSPVSSNALGSSHSSLLLSECTACREQSVLNWSDVLRFIIHYQEHLEFGN